MKPYDVVKLIKPFKGMEIGTKGTILEKYSDGYFEVEFFDEDDNLIDVCPLTGDYLEVTWVDPRTNG